MKKITVLGKVKNGKLVHNNDIIIAQFIKENDNKNIEVTFRSDNSLRYYIHKYYRGFLLPDITNAAGEVSQEKMHYKLKKEFMFIECEGFQDMPTKHLSGCMFFERDGELIGYVPSMSKITQDEGKKFILNCEDRLFVDLGSRIGVSAKTKMLNYYQHEVGQLRQEIFKNDRNSV